MSTMVVNRLKNGLCGLILAIALLNGNIVGKSVDNPKKGQQRSYIDIDVTDPFKVPKTSEYIDQPIPTYDSNGNKKADENDNMINYKIGNVKVQSENKVDVDEGQNRGYDEQPRQEEEDSRGGHGFNNFRPEDGPEVPADQEESPSDVEPEPYHSDYDDEHMHGESRHNVPKGEWKHEETGPRNDDRYHEESGGHWKGDSGPPANDAYSRREGDEEKFSRGDGDRENSEHVREREEEHEGNWERRGEGDYHGGDYGARDQEPRVEGEEHGERENTKDREYYERESSDSRN